MFVVENRVDRPNISPRSSVLGASRQDKRNGELRSLWLGTYHTVGWSQRAIHRTPQPLWPHARPCLWWKSGSIDLKCCLDPENGQYWTIWARDKWTIKLWHRNVNIFSGQPWWHIVFLRTFISRAVSSENVKMLRLYETGDLEKRKILNLLSTRWDKIAIGDMYKKTILKET